MRRNTSHFKLRLGLFVITGCILLGAGIFYIGQQKNLFNPVVNITTTFKNISGLEVGNNVRFSGINVGTVNNIRIINDTTVMVHMIVKRDVQEFIKTDSYIRISAEGIIGDKIANIMHGSAGAASIEEGGHLSSVEPVETEDIIMNLKKTGENATIISGELAEILYNINSGKGTISRLIHDSTIAGNIDQMILNLKKSSKGLDENMEAAKHNIFFRGYFKKKEERKRKRNQKKNK